MTLHMKHFELESIDFFVYFKVMTKNFWFVLPAAIFFLALGFIMANVILKNNVHSPNDPEKFTIVHGVALVCTFMLNQGYSLSQKTQTVKCLVFFTSMFVFVLSIHYGAILTSSVVVEPKPKYIRNFKEAVEQGINVLVIEDTSNELALKTAKNDSPLHDLYYNTGETLLVSNVEEAGDILRERHDPLSMFFGTMTSVGKEENIVSGRTQRIICLLCNILFPIQ